MRLSPIVWLDRDSGLKIEVAQYADGAPLSYAVRDGFGLCLGHDGEWVVEPLPSNRDKEFLADTRFESFPDATTALAMAAYRMRRGGAVEEDEA